MDTDVPQDTRRVGSPEIQRAAFGFDGLCETQQHCSAVGMERTANHADAHGT